jgi:hypothetical protein
VTWSINRLLALPDFDDDGRYELAVWFGGYEWEGIDVVAWRHGHLEKMQQAFCGI